MTSKLVKLAEFGSLIEAEMIRSLLETEEIPCEIPDRLAASTLSFVPQIGFARILVRESDLERAKQLIEAMQDKKALSDDDSSSEQPTDAEGDLKK